LCDVYSILELYWRGWEQTGEVGMETPGFGDWLKRRRQALDLTQKELAQAVGCSVSALRKIEAGTRQPSQQIAELLAAHLALPEEEYAAFVRFARRGSNAGTPTLNGPPQANTSTLWAGNALRVPSAAVSVPNNLPTFLASFVGRERVVDDVLALLWKVDVRLLTLTGPPGIGKTRLSVEVASRLLDDFSDGVYFVALASVNRGEAVLPAIAQVFSVRERGGSSLEESLGEFLRSKNLLLLLDNFEQITEAGQVVGELLRAAPG